MLYNKHARLSRYMGHCTHQPPRSHNGDVSSDGLQATAQIPLRRLPQKLPRTGKFRGTRRNGIWPYNSSTTHHTSPPCWKRLITSRRHDLLCNADDVGFLHNSLQCKLSRHRRDSTVELIESRRAVCIEFANSSRRLPMDLIEKLKTKHVDC